MQGFGEAAERLRRSTVQVLTGARATRGVGSGVIWSADGAIVTNAHVIRSDNPRVQLWDGRSLPAAVVSRDERADLAHLRLNAAQLPAATWRASGLRAGELVMAVGNPWGFTGALTTGVLQASAPIRGLGSRQWIQAAIRLAPGNSGGPLADVEGLVLGINTMVLSGGLALAIPAGTIADFLKRGSRPALGVVVRPVEGPAGRAALLVLEVAPDGPGDRASLLIGDLLIGANGRYLESAGDLGDALDESAGALLRLRFLRGDRAVEREVAIPIPGAQREAA